MILSCILLIEATCSSWVCCYITDEFFFSLSYLQCFVYPFPYVPWCLVSHHPSVHLITWITFLASQFVRELYPETIQCVLIQGFLFEGYVLTIRILIVLPGLSTALMHSLSLSRAFLQRYTNSPLGVASTNKTLWYLRLSYNVLAFPYLLLSSFNGIPCFVPVEEANPILIVTYDGFKFLHDSFALCSFLYRYIPRAACEE